MTGAQRMLAACRRQPVDATPVWFMRQAGRSFKEYRALKEKYDFLTMAKTPEIAAQVTLLPVGRLHVDAAVMFSDIALVLEGLGLEYHIEPEVGPVVAKPVRTQADVDALMVVDAEEATPYVFETLRILRRELEGQTAVIGFAGSPFTLACYMIEGGRSRSRMYEGVKALMFTQPGVWHGLMEKITEATIRYLLAQAKAGAQVIQLFDSWVGVLGPSQYEQYVLPYSKRIFEAVRPTGAATINFGTGTSSLLGLMATAGSDIIGVDWREDLGAAWRTIGYEHGIQGNLDPAMLLAPFPVIAEGARRVLRQAGGRPGHIFNLGHGVLPETIPDDLARLVELVHNESRKPHPATAGKR
ncbi:MAG: uroporphyrinogen decarboxylase [SAR202 cluster bacterium]|nr:uroporphyrinogen decarboxylase [SAR202 cluster bacterium]